MRFMLFWTPWSIQLGRLPESGHRVFHMTIGSYMGLKSGLEVLAGQRSGEYNFDWNNFDLHGGLALPIGLEMGWGVDGNGMCCSIGVFVAPVDLGLAVDYRIAALRDSTAANEPSEVYWTRFLSPSIYLVLGFPRDWPTALAVGVQYSPGLRRGVAEEGTLVDAWRLSLMFGIDVTLFTL